MFKFIKQLFCKHDYAYMCDVKTYNGTNYIDSCKDYKKTKCVAYNGDTGKLYNFYCDYHYLKCKKCGKEKYKNTTRFINFGTKKI